eukprot:TRINITY_DN4995_c0_g1_i2.p1 TRINITY_DN4995_c0_g1~~TRINITY_DN4995_c0_g1_i2.p1  ORF type:complete len:154 (-),score=13.51 TRINITY_DN4995_c0_g1_i2:94-555(-)
MMAFTMRGKLGFLLALFASLIFVTCRGAEVSLKHEMDWEPKIWTHIEQTNDIMASFKEPLEESLVMAKEFMTIVETGLDAFQSSFAQFSNGSILMMEVVDKSWGGMNSGIVDVSSAFSEWGSVFNSSGILVADSIDKVVAATDNVARDRKTHV